MKFDLRSKVFMIFCKEVNSLNDAIPYIQKMYISEYGEKAKDLQHWYHTTPNEERLAAALMERFSGNVYSMTKNEAFSVDCGANTYVFASEPWMGPFCVSESIKPLI